MMPRSTPLLIVCFVVAVIGSEVLAQPNPPAERPTVKTADSTTDKPMTQEEYDAAGAKILGIGLLGVICVGMVGLLFYFLPTFISCIRGHQNTAAIAILNLFLGWTFLGWVAALVWAFTAVERPAYRQRVVYDV